MFRSFIIFLLCLGTHCHDSQNTTSKSIQEPYEFIGLPDSSFLTRNSGSTSQYSLRRIGGEVVTWDPDLAKNPNLIWEFFKSHLEKPRTELVVECFPPIYERQKSDEIYFNFGPILKFAIDVTDFVSEWQDFSSSVRGRTIREVINAFVDSKEEDKRIKLVKSVRHDHLNWSFLINGVMLMLGKNLEVHIRLVLHDNVIVVSSQEVIEPPFWRRFLTGIAGLFTWKRRAPGLEAKYTLSLQGLAGKIFTAIQSKLHKN